MLKHCTIEAPYLAGYLFLLLVFLYIPFRVGGLWILSLHSLGLMKPPSLRNLLVNRMLIRGRIKGLLLSLMSAENITLHYFLAA